MSLPIHGRHYSLMLLAAILLAGISGCASMRVPSSSVPTEWDHLLQSDAKDACADISGNYSNSPDAGGWDVNRRLSELFDLFRHSFDRYSNQEIAFLTIQSFGSDLILINGTHRETGENALSVALVNMAAKAEVPEGAVIIDFSCDSGFVNISGRGWLPIIVYAPVGIMSLSALRIRKLVDGSLIVNYGRSTTGTLPLVPVVPFVGTSETSNEWYRFQPHQSRSN